MDWLVDTAKYITEIGVIVGALSKLLDIKLKPSHDRDRMGLRYNIVSFASDLHKGQPKTRYEFMSIFEQITEYEKICNELKVENHLFEQESKFIDECYKALDIENKVDK